MATLLAQVQAPEPGDQDVKVSFNVGRTAALLILGCLALTGALVLWLADEDTAAPYFFALGEAIVVGGFGVAVGEKSGAEEGARRAGP